MLREIRQQDFFLTHCLHVYMILLGTIVHDIMIKNKVFLKCMLIKDKWPCDQIYGDIFELKCAITE